MVMQSKNAFMIVGVALTSNMFISRMTFFIISTLPFPFFKMIFRTASKIGSHLFKTHYFFFEVAMVVS